MFDANNERVQANKSCVCLKQGVPMTAEVPTSFEQPDRLVHVKPDLLQPGEYVMLSLPLPPNPGWYTVRTVLLGEPTVPPVGRTPPEIVLGAPKAFQVDGTCPMSLLYCVLTWCTQVRRLHSAVLGPK
jgi:hypothetical protein